jgi:hypothetical protein
MRRRQRQHRDRDELWKEYDGAQPGADHERPQRNRRHPPARRDEDDDTGDTGERRARGGQEQRIEGGDRKAGRRQRSRE